MADLAFILRVAATKEWTKIERARQEEGQDLGQQNPWRPTKINAILSDNAQSLVFIEVIFDFSRHSSATIGETAPHARILSYVCISLTFSRVVMGTQKHLTIKSGPTKHLTLRFLYFETLFDAGIRSVWSVFRPSLPQTPVVHYKFIINSL